MPLHSEQALHQLIYHPHNLCSTIQIFVIVLLNHLIHQQLWYDYDVAEI